MGNYNKYATKVNEIAKASFAEYRKAEAAYKQAAEKYQQFPERASGMVGAQYAANRARAEADYLEAKAAFDQAKRAMETHVSEIAALRKDLAAELADHYAADPAALDSGTLELLKSGILKTNEYVKLMNEAQAAGNYTMARLIAKYASDAAADVMKRYGENDQRARELRAIGYMADNNNGENVLAAFDVMADVYKRAASNPGMIDHWSELTAEVSQIL